MKRMQLNVYEWINIVDIYNVMYLIKVFNDL